MGKRRIRNDDKSLAHDVDTCPQNFNKQGPFYMFVCHELGHKSGDILSTK